MKTTKHHDALTRVARISRQTPANVSEVGEQTLNTGHRPNHVAAASPRDPAHIHVPPPPLHEDLPVTRPVSANRQGHVRRGQIYGWGR